MKGGDDVNRNTRARLERLERGLKRDSVAIPPERYAEVAEIIRKIETGEIPPMTDEEAEEFMEQVKRDARRHYGWRG